jgi:tetratricopeptide (TPR) repeat protein
MKQILVGLLSIVLGGIVSAQEDPRTREPNTARPTKGNDPRDSRTTKTKEAAANRPTSFPEAIRNLRKAVFLVGYSGGHGSAWVLSKKHRLLATNAHVADMFHKARKENLAFQAMMNGTKQVYTVTKAWYHPGVRRFPTADENLSVCSTDPAFGDVDPASPDLAVLQLGPDGPDLPVEFELARAAVLYDLQGLPVAILGYPGHDTLSWPKNGGPVQATFHEGVVSRVTDFRFEATDDELAQCLQYTMETFSGFSGSPIFLRTGEIIGLHNSSRTVRAPGGGPARMIANGIRADSLSELLVYHKLDGLVVPPSPPPDKLVRRWAQPDPAMDLYRKLWTLNKEAGELIYGAHDFPAGIQKCNEAIALFKAYAPAYRTRCNAYNNWEFSNSSRLSFEKRRELLLKAYADATAYIDLHRNLTPDALQTRIVVVNNLGFLTKNHKFNEQALDDCEKILTLKNLTAWQRASAISSMAVALSNLDRPNEARQKHEQALQVNPDGDVLWDNRASFFENNDNPAQARYDKAMAACIRKRDLLLNRTQSKDVKIISKVENQLADGDPVDGRGCHVHHWETELEGGYFYQIDLKNPAFRSNKDYDPILRLTSDKGTLIQEDDDGGGYPHARIFFTAPRTATYRFVVTSYIQRQTGPYVLTVKRIAEDK